MDPLQLLEQAVTIARASGQEATGWMMQSSDEGYVAWLYREDDQGQWPLFEDVDVQPTALGAAQWCLARASGELPIDGAN